MPNLRDQLSGLASDFASAVLDAIRGASLEDLLAESSAAPRRGPGRPRGGTKAQPTAARTSAPAVSATSKGRAKGGRLPRRSPADIDRALGTVVSTLKATKGQGMRSEEIQKALKLDKRELPRVLRTGIEKKTLRSKGQKRATVYFAA